MPNSFLNLISIKGIGPISASVFIATIGDINDFHRPEKLTAYFGIVPRVSQSNQQCTIGRITKRGSKIARTSLVQCTWVAIRYSPYLNSFYEHVKKSVVLLRLLLLLPGNFLQLFSILLKMTGFLKISQNLNFLLDNNHRRKSGEKVKKIFYKKNDESQCSGMQ